MENENPKSKKGVILIIVLCLVLAIGGYFYFGNSKTDSTNKGPSVATVNGVAITQADYDLQLNNATTSYKAQGVDIENAEKLAQIKTEVLDGLINNELISQGVSSAGIKTSSEEIEKQYQLILTQAGGADKLKTELVTNNTTEAQLRENISKQLAIQTYLLKNIDTASITVSDAEIEQFYTDYSKDQTANGQKDIPALKDLSEQIKQQIISNKQNALVADFLVSLRTKAKIEITVK